MADSLPQRGTRWTNMLKQLIPGRQFPYPKSLYAVEDALRFFLDDNPTAVVLDFFADREPPPMQ